MGDRPVVKGRDSEVRQLQENSLQTTLSSFRTLGRSLNFSVLFYLISKMGRLGIVLEEYMNIFKYR